MPSNSRQNHYDRWVGETSVAACCLTPITYLLASPISLSLLTITLSGAIFIGSCGSTTGFEKLHILRIMLVQFTDETCALT